MTADVIFSKAQTLLNSGAIDKARALAKTRDTRHLRDAAVHRAWADLLEQLGIFEDMIMELNLVVRDDPADEAAYGRLAEALMDQGHPDKAVQCYRALTRRFPDNPAHRRDLGNALEEAGRFGEALSVYQDALENTGNPDFRHLIRALDFLEAEAAENDGPAEAGDQIAPSRHHLVTFCGLFSGREGVYARQWASPSGETGYTPVKEPLTLKVAENHILGRHTVGAYPMRLDNTVNFIAFDLDLSKFAVNKTIARQSLWEKAMSKVHRRARELMDVCAAGEVAAYLEDSGFKGRHVWVFLETPIPAGVARKFGETALDQLKGDLPEVTVELFPKQGRLKPGGLGNLIKLPLGFHKKTGRRAVFIEPDGRPVSSQLDFLETVRKTPRRAIYAMIQRLQKPAPTKLPPAPADKPPWEASGRGAGFVTAPEDEYDPDRDLQFQHLMTRCPVIRAIVEKIRRESMVTGDESRVLIHTLGHLDHGPDVINHLFGNCVNAEPSMFLKSRLRGNPVSCPKIRSRAPEITAREDCNCQFDDDAGLYPTPMIYVWNMDRAGRPPAAGGGVDAAQFQNLFSEYLSLKSRVRDLNAALQDCERRLHAFFDAAGTDTFNTAMGDLVRVKEEAGASRFTLRIG